MLFAQDAGAVLGGLVCAIVLTLTVGCLIGAVILRTAIWLFNRLAGTSDDPAAVPEPSMGGAMGLLLVTYLVNAVVVLVLGVVLAMRGPVDRGAALLAPLIGGLASPIVMTAILSALLPATVGRAFLVTLLYLLIVLVIGVGLMAILLGFVWVIAGPIRFSVAVLP